MLLLLCGVPVFFYSCRKQELAGSPQSVKLFYYAYEGSVTPVEVTWSAGNSITGDNIFIKTGSVNFTVAPEDVLRVNITPDRSNRFLNSYFNIVVNNVTVRSVKLYNDADKNTESVDLAYYGRNMSKFHVRFLHHTNEHSTTSPYELVYCLNDSVYDHIQDITLDASAGDRVSFRLKFKIQPNNEVPVYHETIMKINGEVVRYDYVKRKGCGYHSCEMTAVLQPYL